jgi:hypothetical protein
MPAKIPKNIRFRQDQIEALAELEDTETDFSALVRKAVDDMLERRRSARVKETPPAYGTLKKKKKRSG